MLQFPSHIDRIAQLMDYAEASHRVISHNIANVNTPGFKRLMLQIDETRHSPENSSEHSTPTIVQDPLGVSRMDGNSVDIDRELGQLNRNSMLFETYSQILLAHLNTMRLAIGRS